MKATPSRSAVVVSDSNLPAMKERSSLHYAFVGAKHFLKNDVLMPAVRGIKWLVCNYFKPIEPTNSFLSIFLRSLWFCVESFSLAWLFGLHFGGGTFVITYLISVLFSAVTALITSTSGWNDPISPMMLTCGSAIYLAIYSVYNGFRKICNYLGDCYAHLAETGKHLEISSDADSK